MQKLINFGLLLTTLCLLDASYGLKHEGIKKEEANLIREDVVHKMNFYRKVVHSLNTFRQVYKLEQEAQIAANFVALNSLDKVTYNSAYGKTVFMCTEVRYIGEVAVDFWYSALSIDKEHEDTKLSEYEGVGNMNQLLWKKSRSIGVGVAKNTIRNLYVIIVYYFPKGNGGYDCKANLPLFSSTLVSETRNWASKIFFNFFARKSYLDKVEPVLSGWSSEFHDDAKYIIESLEKNPERLEKLKALREKQEWSNSNEEDNQTEDDKKVMPEGLSELDAMNIRIDILNKLNYYREHHHGLSKLTIDDEVQEDAQEMSNYMLKKGYDAEEQFNVQYGRTIFICSEVKYIGEVAADIWYSGLGSANGNEGEGFFKNEAVRYMTQVLWKKSKTIGIGVSKHVRKNGYLIIAYYYPPGNVQNEYINNLPVFTPYQITRSLDFLAQIFYKMGRKIFDQVFLPLLPGWSSEFHPDARIKIERLDECPERVKALEQFANTQAVYAQEEEKLKEAEKRADAERLANSATTQESSSNQDSSTGGET